MQCEYENFQNQDLGTWDTEVEVTSQEEVRRQGRVGYELPILPIWVTRVILEMMLLVRPTRGQGWLCRVNPLTL